MLFFLPVFLVQLQFVTTDPSCARLEHVASTAVDYILDRYLPHLKVQNIPNQKIGSIMMTHCQVYGLSTLYRSCPITMIPQAGDSKTFRIKGCMGAGNITFTSTIRIAGSSTPLFAVATLTKFDLDGVVSVKFAKGSKAQMEDLNVKSMKWKIDLKGASGLKPLLSAKAKKMGPAVMRLAKFVIKNEIQKEFNKHPL